jgi:hypothetical protein
LWQFSSFVVPAPGMRVYGTAHFFRRRPVYVHCWGGKGRTGTVVGCYLVRHGIAEGEAALKAIQKMRRNDPKAHEPSPETREQCDFVLRWKAEE